MKIVGQPTLQDIIDANEVLMEEGKFVFRLRFWDLSECVPDFSSADLQTIALLSERQMEQNPSRTAILATADLTYGISRMFQVFRKSEHNALAVFRDENEAMVWLLTD